MEYYARMMVRVFGWGSLVVKIRIALEAPNLLVQSEHTNHHTSVIFYIDIKM